MFQKLKQIIPSSFKNNLRKRFRNEVFKIDSLDPALVKRVTELEKEVFELQPEVFSCTAEIKEAIEKNWHLSSVSIPGNMNVSKHDYMYQFLKKHYHDNFKAYVEYIISGAHMVDILKRIAQQTGKSFSEINAFLDFASGYGRLTRYMSELIDTKRIWVTDIKQGAIQFQVEQFGVNGILSCENPDAFQLDKQFDFIFVGSLFSHLPDESFGRWLQQIYNLLADNGLLIFTVHDQSLRENLFQKNQNIAFIPVSEEVNLLSKDGRLPGAQYGMTYVSENYVNAQIDSLKPKPLQYRRFKKGMWVLQDLYIVSREFRKDLSELIL